MGPRKQDETPLLYHVLEILKNELLDQYHCRDACADIIIITHNQSELVDQCLQSIQRHTRNFKLWVWDNAGDVATSKVILQHKPHHYQRSPTNLGFIRPNNILFALGDSPYVILLNSDTTVKAGWKEALLGYLQNHPRCGCVGCMGGRLNYEGRGAATPGRIDYVMGWCMALPRQILSNSLFDETFQFAHCEDSDLCLRLRHEGFDIHALHLDLVDHVGSATIKGLVDTKPLRDSFAVNHKKLVAKWQTIMPEVFERTD